RPVGRWASRSASGVPRIVFDRDLARSGGRFDSRREASISAFRRRRTGLAAAFAMPRGGRPRWSCIRIFGGPRSEREAARSQRRTRVVLPGRDRRPPGGLIDSAGDCDDRRRFGSSGSGGRASGQEDLMRFRSARGASLSTPLMLSLAIASSVAAQARGVHPHVAPIQTIAQQGGYNQPAGTPQFNVPDGVWNLGEGFVVGPGPDAELG